MEAVCVDDNLNQVKAEGNSPKHGAGYAPALAEGNSFHRLDYLGIAKIGSMLTQSPTDGLSKKCGLNYNADLFGWEVRTEGGPSRCKDGRATYKCHDHKIVM